MIATTGLGGALDELEKWLTPLGLAALAPTLRANDIDLDILPDGFTQLPTA